MNRSIKAIVAGSRDITDRKRVFAVLDRFIESLPLDQVVSTGGARGVGRLGEEWAKSRGIPVKLFPAEWGVYGKSAGYKRNEEMADHADILIAFWDGRSKDTAHMIDIASSKGLPVYLYINFELEP